MIGKKVTSICVLIVFSGLMACHTVNKVSSNYQEDPVMVDGKLDEWGTGLDLDKTSELYYAVSHDDDNLYVALQTKDAMVQRKILMFGMTLWMDTTGGKKQQRGLRYPIPSEKRSKVPEGNNDGNGLPQRARRALPRDSRRVIKPALMSQMTLLGFNDIKKETLSIAEKAGVDVRIQRDKLEGLTYEAKIPFDMLYSEGRHMDKGLSLGIITGYLELPERDSRMRSPGGMNPGGGMYPGRGRMGGQQNTGSRFGNLEELQKSTRLWLKGIELVRE